MSERSFQLSLEEILIRDEPIDCLIIGKPNIHFKWFVGLRIAEMIKQYLKRKDIEVSIHFTYLIEDIVPNINKMKSYDIQILRIQDFKVDGMISYIDSERAKQKNFIYISHESEYLNRINKSISSLVIYQIHVLSSSKDKIKCEVLNPKGSIEIEFLYPNNDLIKNYNTFREETLNRVIKRQL
ncbi:MAG: hypothetical protein ACFFDF_00965 [Candidatus Odinarchaeota archaeon]